MNFRSVWVSFTCSLFIVTGCSQEPNAEHGIQSQAVERMQIHERHMQMLQASKPKRLKSDRFHKVWNGLNDTVGYGQSIDPVVVKKIPKSVPSFNVQLAPFVHLTATVNAADEIDSVTITGTPSSKKERFMMIDCWTHLIATLSKLDDPSATSIVLREIGVRPDADLTDINNHDPFSIQGATYDANFINDVYEFRYQGEASQ
ncbi:hypothetical protein [Paenibacillus roseipurpureus]|uniref:Lipoprotein n=1 Tax=Paenibacillus roseopurpureus TaxID=2918901 RepID=A0AA96RIB8_9BACL|nr:hypothetical protein [Paenibacillus sp. MBLB1832]WNR44193.1 hypothetical protein MJB10_24430 [Paenibacillus sp. MBLB1832]